ncbi:MAG: hypothetical protein RI985_935 [Chloroflexota bacterium]
MQIRHIPPIIIMIISGMIGIRLALSPVAVTGTTCTEDHPYYLSDCDEPNWTATPVTVYPTASENDMPDTDPPIQIPTQNTAITPTVENTQLALVIPQSSNTTSFTLTPTVTPTLIPTTTVVPTRIVSQTIPDQLINETSSTIECRRQTRLVIQGMTDPYSLLLLSFADRIVGGGISYASGGYAIPMVVGDEARGVYLVEIRQRNTNKVVKQFSCTVP